MSAPLSAAGARSALLSEQRYRRQFCAADKRQDLAVILLVGLPFSLMASNDVLMLRTGAMLSIALAGRLMILLGTVVSAALLWRAQRPAQYDRATTLWLLSISLANIPLNLTRLPSGQFVGVLLAFVAFAGICYWVMRGPLWPRIVAAALGSITALVLLWNPRAMVVPLLKNASTMVLFSINVVGWYAARSFDSQRRKGFWAERHERMARKELAIKLRELAIQKERTEAASHARTAFLAAMSHEFRTPMNAVIGLSDLLLESPLGAVDKTRVQTISESARALLLMLNDILDFAKIDAQKLTLSLAPFDLHALCTSVVELMHPAARKRAIALELHCPDPLPPWLLGDDARLRQVLVNLLGNAIKFTEAGRVRLHVTAQLVAGHDPLINVAISDTGIGMTEETVARLFRPFEQADAGTTRRYGGTGLGLSISRQIVVTMGGDIQVSSLLGHGSTFSFALRLPLSLPAFSPPLFLPEPPDPHAPQRPLSVLVVDDYPVNREVAQAKLCRLGHHVDLASDGPEAIAAAAKHDYDVIFMDLQMPGVSGLQATAQILQRASNRRPPYIIALTASEVEEDRTACREVGMRDFLSKPLSQAQLDAALAKLRGDLLGTGASSSASKALSHDTLAKLRQVEEQGQSQFVARLCQLFLTETHKRLPRMAQALSQGDAQLLCQEAHTTKSGCTTVGAAEMAALCTQLEQAARQGDLTSASAILDALSVQLVQVEQALQPQLVGAVETP